MDQRRRNASRRRRAQAKRRRKRSIILKGIFTLFIVVSILIAFFVWKKYGATKERADLNGYYGIKNENQLAVVINNGVMEPAGILSEGKVYVEYSLVRDFINERFYWDSNENILLYTLPNDIVSVGVGNSEYSVSKAKNTVDYVILKTEGSTAYVALDFVKQYTDMEYEVYDNPGRVVVNAMTGTTKVAQVKKDTQVRYQGGVKSPILTDIKKNDEVRVIEEEGSWKKICTKDGFIGYVKASTLRKEEEKTIDRGFEAPTYTSMSKDYKINMAWHNVTNVDANAGVLEMIARTKGLTTISPTWFHVADTTGNISSISSADYVNYAHMCNIEVWAAIRDFDGGINSEAETYELLSHSSYRENLIGQLIGAALQVGLDGINVDFEKISVECGDHYIQFIRELSIKCHQNGILLSVDNYVPQSFNQHYNRKEQGVFADYVVIMGYDEHYAGSEEAGSVASYDFVKQGIEATLKEVPAEKVINAVPFFTRLWCEAADGTVSSEAYGMADVEYLLSQSGATPVWDEATQQNYAEWESGGNIYKIWIEDAASLEPKLKLIQEYNLAGTGAWRLGYEKPEVWDLILKYVN